MNAATEMRELEQRAMRIVIYSASCIGAYKLTPFMLWNVQPINEARELTPTIESTWTHHRIRTNVSGHFVLMFNGHDWMRQRQHRDQGILWRIDKSVYSGVVYSVLTTGQLTKYFYLHPPTQNSTSC